MKGNHKIIIPRGNLESTRRWSWSSSWKEVINLTVHDAEWRWSWTRKKVGTEAAARRWDRDERANYWQVLHIKYECVGFVAELRWLPGSEGWMADIGSGSTRRGRIPSLNSTMRDLRVSGQAIWSRITAAHKLITSVQLKQTFCTTT